MECAVGYMVFDNDFTVPGLSVGISEVCLPYYALHNNGCQA